MWSVAIGPTCAIDDSHVCCWNCASISIAVFVCLSRTRMAFVYSSFGCCCLVDKSPLTNVAGMLGGRVFRITNEVKDMREGPRGLLKKLELPVTRGSFTVLINGTKSFSCLGLLLIGVTFTVGACVMSRSKHVSGATSCSLHQALTPIGPQETVYTDALCLSGQVGSGPMLPALRRCIL